MDSSLIVGRAGSVENGVINGLNIAVDHKSIPQTGGASPVVPCNFYYQNAVILTVRLPLISFVVFGLLITFLVVRDNGRLRNRGAISILLQ